MASTSPYSGNDYQAVSTYRPYQLPVNDIFKAISAQNEFWDMGARRVKSAYDSALDLKLSLAPNREIRDQFMKDAEKQLTKLSSMNLADPTVQRQGLAIFKPLMRDEGIVSDDQATRHIEKINSDALSYRSKENGKYYSSTNHQYALTGAKEFKNATDRMAGKEYLQNAKDYEQFYDPSTELTGILKNCKPDKASGESVKGYYIRGFSNESLSAMKINSCLDAGLSEKAKRQLQINGAVTYRNNPEALAQKYVPHLQGTRTGLAEQKAAIEGVLANKGNLKSLKADQLQKLGINSAADVTPDFLQSLEEKRLMLDDRINNINHTIGKIGDGDFSPILGENFEQVASMVYSKDYMHNVGEGFSYDFTNNTVKADPVQMMFFKESQQNSRQEDDQDHDRYMQEQKLNNDLQMKLMESQMKAASEKGKKTKDEPISALGDLTPGELNESRIMNDSAHPFSSVEGNDSYDQVTKKRQEIATKRSELNNWFTNQLKTYGYDPAYKSGSPEARQWINNFKLTAGSDPTKQKLIDQYESTMDKYIVMEDLYKNTQQTVDEKMVPLKNKAEESRLALNKEGALNMPLTDGRARFNLNKNMADIAADLASGKASIQREGFGGAATIIYRENGKEFMGRVEHGATRDKLMKLFDWSKDHGDDGKKVLKARNDMMAKETVIQREGYQIPGLNLPTSPFKQKLAGAIGLGPEYIKNINVGQTDANGRVIIDLNKPKAGNSESDYDYEAAIDKLMRYGAGKNVRVNSKGEPDPNGTSVVLTGVTELDLIDENNLSHVLNPYVRNLESRSNPNKSSSTGYMRATNGRQYRLDISPSYNGGYTYKIIDQDAPNAPVQVLDDRQTALQTFEAVLQRAKGSVPTR